MACSTKFDWKLTSEIPARNLPQICFSAMGIRLKCHIDQVAFELGIDNDALTRIQTDPNPGKALLEEWSRRPDTTVFVLYSVLQKLERHDMISVLHDYLEAKVDVIFLVKGKHGSKIYTLKVASHTKMRDMLKKMTEVATANEHEMTFTMENKPTNILDAEAHEFKGRQITISLDETLRITSEPVAGVQLQQEKRNTSPDDCDVTTIPELQTWPELSRYQVTVIFEPRLKHDGVYLLKHSKEVPGSLSLSVTDQGKIVQFRIYNNDKKNRFWIMTDGPLFHTVNELISYYTKHEIKEKQDPRGPVLKFQI